MTKVTTCTSIKEQPKVIGSIAGYHYRNKPQVGKGGDGVTTVHRQKLSHVVIAASPHFVPFINVLNWFEPKYHIY